MPNLPDPQEAYRVVVNMVARRLRRNPNPTDQQLRRMQCLLIAADHIREMSGSWSPDDMIWNAEPEATKLAADLERKLGL